MKRILFIMLLLVTTNGMAQTKKDNVFILPGLPLEKIKSVLFLNGYSIENNDTTYISTSSKEAGLSAMAVKLMFYRTDTATYLKALAKLTVSINFGGVKTEDDFAPLTFAGAKSSPNKRAWYEVDKIAKALSSNVTYAKQ